MEDLRKSCIEARKAIERYTDMFKEFSKQLLFIYKRWCFGSSTDEIAVNAPKLWKR